MTDLDHSLAGRLTAMTPARVRFDGRSALPMGSVLDFQACHAKARDAIWTALDEEGLAQDLAPMPVLHLRSQAEDRSAYIRRPDFGRLLADGQVAALPDGPYDLCIVIADGLSARAVNSRGAPLALAIAAALPDLRCTPVALVRNGRVAISDQIASSMQARICVMLIGERPGLTVSDSVGAYITRNARVGTRDSERNCVSNIHDSGGLTEAEAVAAIAWLIRKADEIGGTGVALKDERTPAPAIE